MANIYSTPSDYWIKSGALTISLNAVDNPQYTQASVLSGAVIIAFKPGVIDYDSSHNYRKWKLTAENTFLKNSEAKYVYARLDRKEDATQALIVYSSDKLDIVGRTAIEEEVEEDPLYYYIYLGSITASVNNDGKSIPRVWDDSFNFGTLATDQSIREESSSELSKMFRLNEVTGMIEVLKKISEATFNTIRIGKKLLFGVKEITDIKRSVDSDEDVPVGEDNLATSKYVEEKALCKDRPDQTSHLLKLLGGVHLGNYIPGIIGAIIDQFGDGEMGSLVLRKFLSVPELRFNRAIVYKGKQIISPGGGCLIESFTLNGDGTWTIVPKLEEGEPLSQDVDDILLAYWHDKDVTTGAFKGFREMKFRVVSADFDAKTFVIVPKPDSLSVPAIAMTLAQVGNFTNIERQTYIMLDSTLGNNNITFFDDCNTWDVEEHQEKSWFGKKKGRTVAGIDVSDYSAVLKHVLMTGLIFQIDEISGDMMRVPCDKGAYVADKRYAYYDRVSHIGALWLCINDKGTDTAPADGNVNWLKQVSEGKPGTPGESIKMLGHWNSAMRPVAANCMVSYAKGIYLSLRETNQAPVSTLMYADGSYMTNQTGGYILASDEVNEDWEMILENGKNGVSILFQGSFPSAPDNPKDGWSYYNTTDKRSYVYQGDKWYVTAIDGKDGKDFEWIYTRTTANDKPAALESIQEDDYVPPGWTDDPQGCTVELPFEWTCKRVKKDGVWQPFSAASIFNMYVVGETGPAGITPCGHWQSANVPYKKTSLVTLYNATFVALVDTSSPPLWLMKWGSGPTDYLTNSTGGYIPLGGVENNLNPEWLMLTPPPVNGNDSTSYWLTAPVSTININSVGSLSPSAVWVSCKKKTGAGAVTDCADYYLAARKYNGSWLAHVSPVKASSLSVSAVGGYTQFTVRAYNSESEANSWSSGFVSEIGIGVSKDGATGDTGPAGSFPRDRGKFVPGTSYVWSPSYRDKILYPFGGIYYNFLVANFGATVTVAPTSADGDGLWEAMGKYKSIATDTLFADGANVAGFMFKNGMLRSQDETNGVPNLDLNGKTGKIKGIDVELSGKIEAKEDSQIAGMRVVGNSLRGVQAIMGQYMHQITGDSNESDKNIIVNNIDRQQVYIFSITKAAQDIGIYLPSILDLTKKGIGEYQFELTIILDSGSRGSSVQIILKDGTKIVHVLKEYDRFGIAVGSVLKLFYFQNKYYLISSTSP